MDAGGEKVQRSPFTMTSHFVRDIKACRRENPIYLLSRHGSFASSAAPSLTMSSYSITIPIFRLNHKEEGVLIAHGDHSSGYTLYIKDHYLMYEYNSCGKVYRASIFN